MLIYIFLIHVSSFVLHINISEYDSIIYILHGIFRGIRFKQQRLFDFPVSSTDVFSIKVKCFSLFLLTLLISGVIVAYSSKFYVPFLFKELGFEHVTV